MFLKLADLRRVWWMPALVLCLWLLAAGAAWAGHGPQAAPRKAILLVTFGTSVPEAQRAFQAIEAATRARFPGVEVRWAYTARMIRHKLAQRGQTIPSPQQALANLSEDGFRLVAAQSLHVIPGEEYEGLVDTARRLAGLPKGLKRVEVGHPLLWSAEDMQRVAKAMLAHAPGERRPGEALLLMGHGTSHPANAAYPAMAYVFQRLDPNVFLATVEGYPSLDMVRQDLLARKVKKAYLIPFMSVAGDHALNDLAGDEPESWRSQLSQAGVACQPVLTGMAEYPEIVQIWLDHLQSAWDRLGKE